MTVGDSLQAATSSHCPVKEMGEVVRKERIEVDLSTAISVQAVHSLLADALVFPSWYGNNWDAFWDAITALVEMPEHLQLLGWSSFEKRFPRDAKIMQTCLFDMSKQYPNLASQVEYL